MIPNSKVWLCENTRLVNDKTDFNTRGFASKSDRLSFFLSKTNASLTFNETMIIEEGKGKVRLPIGYTSVNQCDYLFFQNTSYGLQYYFCFITKVEYKNDECTFVYFEVDNFMTWFYELTLKKGFIERETVTIDTRGLHTVSEGLETGDYIDAGSETLGNTIDMTTILAVTEYPDAGLTSWLRAPLIYDNIAVGLALLAFSPSFAVTLNLILQYYEVSGKSDAIVSIYSVPTSLIPSAQINTLLPLTSFHNANPTAIVTGKFDSIDGYVPRNKKLLCYPYNFLYITNGGGSSANFVYEQFEESVIGAFTMVGDVLPSGGIYLVPIGYRGTGYNYDYALFLTDYPQTAYNIDVYKNWLANNQASITMGIGASMINTGIGMLTSPLALVAGVQQVGSTVGTMIDKQVQPAQAKGSMSSSATKAINSQFKFKALFKQIRPEYARIFDDIFDRIGYQINEIKDINLFSRQSWNYVKTLGFSASGNIPSYAMKDIKETFDKGVRFWHTDDIGNYGLSNTTL